MCSKCTIPCHEGVGYYTFPLITPNLYDPSDTLTSRFPWGHVGLRANRRHHVFQSGSLIGLRSDGASRGCMCRAPRGRVEESSDWF